MGRGGRALSQVFETRGAARRIAALGCALVVVGLAPSARAGGLYLQEFATPSMSVAGAGRQSLAEDASTAWHNPAGMTRLEAQQFMAGAGGVVGDINFDAEPGSLPGSSAGPIGGFGPIVTGFYVLPLGERWRFGASLLSFSAAALDYRSEWTGRFQAQDVDILTMALTPTLAYKVSDWLSVGIGGTLLYAQLDMKLATPVMPEGRLHLDDLDAFDAGLSGSLLLTPREGTRIGVRYIETLEPDVSGKLRFSGPIPPDLRLSLQIPFPQSVEVGFYQELGERWALLGTFRWEDWSRFGRLPVSIGPVDAVGKTGWHDTVGYALGVHYQLDEDWRLQAGMAYDTSPVKASDRHPAFPIDRQIRYAVGVQHQWTESVNVGIAFEYADYGTAKIRNTKNPARPVLGEFSKNDLFFLSVNLNWTARAER
ncbi:MAG: outer membrane protein transport protein [Deltaproteobacteria bacterium]|nr:MAG: outer membrane protein transport protein [Deltaproteobacteria bacterium]